MDSFRHLNTVLQQYGLDPVQFLPDGHKSASEKIAAFCRTHGIEEPGSPPPYHNPTPEEAADGEDD